jgi:isopropylmalate/homocitrate/citramalate synthase
VEQGASGVLLYEVGPRDGLQNEPETTVCGCPYEGDVAVAAVVALTRALFDRGAAEVSLGDTIGVGHPSQVRAPALAVAGGRGTC